MRIVIHFWSRLLPVCLAAALGACESGEETTGDQPVRLEGAAREGVTPARLGSGAEKNGSDKDSSPQAQQRINKLQPYSVLGQIEKCVDKPDCWRVNTRLTPDAEFPLALPEFLVALESFVSLAEGGETAPTFSSPLLPVLHLVTEPDDDMVAPAVSEAAPRIEMASGGRIIGQVPALAGGETLLSLPLSDETEPLALSFKTNSLGGTLSLEFSIRVNPNSGDASASTPRAGRLPSLRVDLGFTQAAYAEALRCAANQLVGQLEEMKSHLDSAGEIAARLGSEEPLFFLRFSTLFHDLLADTDALRAFVETVEIGRLSALERMPVIRENSTESLFRMQSRAQFYLLEAQIRRDRHALFLTYLNTRTLFSLERYLINTNTMRSM